MKLKREVAQLKDEIEELETERADPSSTRKANQRSSDDERVIRALESSVKDLRQQLHLSAEDLAEAREAQELADVRIASMQQQLVQERARRAEIERGLQDGHETQQKELATAREQLAQHQHRSDAWEKERQGLQAAQRRAEQNAAASHDALDGQGATVERLERQLDEMRQVASQERLQHTAQQRKSAEQRERAERAVAKNLELVQMNRRLESRLAAAERKVEHGRRQQRGALLQAANLTS